MTTINYDKPVRDFIAGLNATGHVTHRSYKKKSVTLHHNGGRLSLQGILDVWKVRPASAHFQVDRIANLGQYVKANEYAWAAGNTKGNIESIHIEMANSTTAPKWEVSEVTWREAARLAGWLFANVIDGKPRPSRTNFFYHKHWKSTVCAGPYMDKVYDEVLRDAQRWYDKFTGKASSRPTISTKAIVEACKGTPMNVTDQFYFDARAFLAWARTLGAITEKHEQDWLRNVKKSPKNGQLFRDAVAKVQTHFGLPTNGITTATIMKMRPYGYTILDYNGRAL